MPFIVRPRIVTDAVKVRDDFQLFMFGSMFLPTLFFL